jgi:hypothetical protein
VGFVGDELGGVGVELSHDSVEGVGNGDEGAVDVFDVFMVGGEVRAGE